MFVTELIDYTTPDMWDNNYSPNDCVRVPQGKNPLTRDFIPRDAVGAIHDRTNGKIIYLVPYIKR